MKHHFPISWFVAAAWCVAGLVAPLPANASVNVTQHHNNLSRDGLYIDAAFTPSAAANVTRDTNFNGTISGNVYAQPLYIEDGPGGSAMVIAVTESNNVYALDAITGNIIWQRNVGTAVALSNLPCGNIDPLGITGTPVVDLASRALFLDAMTTPDGGTTKKHLIYSLNVDTGATNPGWPVDVNASAMFGSTSFTSSVQNERAALGLVNGVIYVPYSGLAGDCGAYHGWVVGVPINNSSSVTAWATAAVGGGIWGVGGVASDGTNMFVVTGNTFSTGGTWQGGEAIIRLQAGPVFSGTTANYWAPTNWFSLDNTDTDLGGCGAVLMDVPGATPSQLVLALGKDQNAYLLNRNNLGGITAPVAFATVSSSAITQAAAAYRTSLGTYFVLRSGGSALNAYKINAANPPTISSAWSISQSGQGSPWITTTDGTNNVIVWVVGSQGDQRLHGYNGDTGAVVYAGGGANELMTGTRKWNTGIVARGRIYLASDNKVYAFTVPTLTISGNVSYCTGSPRPVPNATLNLSGDATASTMSDSSGNYQFLSAIVGGNYTVTPAKGDLPPGVSTNGIDTTDALAVQRHFLGIALTGCGLSAGDVNASGLVDTTDALAIQQFFLFSPNPLAAENRTGQWRFSPANRTYPGITGNQTAQNYDGYVLGDVNGDLVFPSAAPSGPRSEGAGRY